VDASNNSLQVSRDCGFFIKSFSSQVVRSIAPVHLLLGALRADPEIIQRLLSGSGESLDDLRQAIESLERLKNASAGLKELSLSLVSKEVLRAAYDVSALL
jgi:Clp amino terminal domain, pathogenicity island component